MQSTATTFKQQVCKPAIVIVAALWLAASTASMARAHPESFADLAAKAIPSVVNISTTIEQDSSTNGIPQIPNLPDRDFFDDFFDRDRTPRSPRGSLGSGFVIDPSGYVVTNHHVIDEADEIVVNFADGESLMAEVVGSDWKTDIALLKVEPEGPLEYVQFGDSDAVQVGEWVVAIGNPFGLGGSVSAGIISARNRDINDGPYDDYIQTDAAINRGNSGGPLFTLDGKVVGVNTAIISPSGSNSGVAFSVPSNIASQVVTQLREFGQTRRGWLGVQIQQVTEDIAEGIGLDEPRGAMVAMVVPESPADEAGVEAQDVILQFDGKDIEEMRDLPRIVAETEVGKRVQVQVWRNERSRTLNVLIGLLEEEGEQSVASLRSGQSSSPTRKLGMKLETLDEQARSQYRIAEEVTGVVVTEVDADSPAANKGIRPGDVISQVGGEPVDKPSDVARIVEETDDAGRLAVLFLVNTGGNVRFVGLRIED